MTVPARSVVSPQPNDDIGIGSATLLNNFLKQTFNLHPRTLLPFPARNCF